MGTSIINQSNNNNSPAALNAVSQDASDILLLLAQIQADEEKEQGDEKNNPGALQDDIAKLESDSTQLTSLADKGVNDTQSVPGDGNIPMSMAAGIIMAFLAMIQFGNDIMQQQTELAQKWAQMQMGAQTDASGKVISIDPSKGVVGQFLTSAQSAAESQGDALRDAAWGAAGAAIMGGLCLVASGVAAGTTSTEASKSQIEDAQAYKGALAGDPAYSLSSSGDGTGMQGLSGEAQLNKVKNIETNMKSGSFENYRTNAKGEQLSNEEKMANEQAVEKIKSNQDPEVREKALEKAQKRVENLENAGSKGQQKFNSLMQTFGIVNSAGASGSNAAGQSFQADATTAAAKLKALSETSQSTMQQLQGTQDKAIQNAQTQHEAANSSAQGLGQALSSANR